MFEADLSSTIASDFEQQIEAFIRIWATLPGSDGDFEGKRLQELQTSLHKRLSIDGTSQPKDIYQLLVEQSQQGLLIVQDFEIVYANPVLPEITGYSLEEMKAFTFGIITAALRPKTCQGPGFGW